MITNASNLACHHDRYALKGSHGLVGKTPIEIDVTQEWFHKL